MLSTSVVAAPPNGTIVNVQNLKSPIPPATSWAVVNILNTFCRVVSLQPPTIEADGVVGYIINGSWLDPLAAVALLSATGLTAQQANQALLGLPKCVSLIPAAPPPLS